MKLDQSIETVSKVALIVVGLLVLAGLLRLIFAEWRYVILMAALAVAAYYIFAHVEK